MSIRFPDSNGADALTRTLLTPPSLAKAANLGWTVFAFIRADRGGRPRVIMSRGNGANTNGDFWMRISTAGVLEIASATTGVTSTVGQPNPITLDAGERYLVGFICRNDGNWAFACKPGSAAQVQLMSGSYSPNTTQPYGLYTGPIGKIGGLLGATSFGNCYAGPMEHVCVWTGDFPLTTGSPNPTLIAAIADGTQDINTAHTAAGMARLAHFPMQHATDFSNLGTSASPLTHPELSEAVGVVTYTGTALRPIGIRPRDTSTCISQVIFTTPGDVSTAITKIGADSGSYSVIVPTRIDARLVNARTRAVIKGPIVLDASPAGGTWAENPNAFTNVLMASGYMQVEYRAFSGGGAVAGAGTALTDWIAGSGLRGAGFHAIWCGQSGLCYSWETGVGRSIPNGVLGVVTIHKGDTSGTPQLTTTTKFSAASAIAAGARGVRMAVMEIQALFPGVPVQMTLIGQSGQGISVFYGAGICAGRWAALKSSFGVLQPLFFAFMVHNSGAGTGYQTELSNLVTFARTQFGVPLESLHMGTHRGAWGDPVPPVVNPVVASAYVPGGDDYGQRGAMAYVAANPADNLWMGSLPLTESIGENLAGARDPHAADNDKGQGRNGTQFAYYLMSASRAIPDLTLKISRVRPVGSTAVIEFGPVNA